MKKLALVLSLILALGMLSFGAAAEPAWQDHVTVAIDVLPNTMDPTSNAFPVLNRLVYDELIKAPARQTQTGAVCVCSPVMMGIGDC